MDAKKCSEFADNLENIKTRIRNNAKYGDNNLQSWLLRNSQVRKNEHVLDIGCGNGAHLREVAAIVKKDNYCIGIDYNASTIEKAKAESKDFKPKVTFFHMDMDTIGEPDSGFQDYFFDLIYSVYAFYYSKDTLKLLDTLRRKLKPDGRIAIVGPHGDNNKDWFVFLTQFLQLPDSVIDASSTFMQKIEEYAHDNFVHTQVIEFVNNITFPSYGILKTYWESNIYFDPKYNREFEKYGKQHFSKNNTFRFAKKAKMVMMKEKK